MNAPHSPAYDGDPPSRVVAFYRQRGGGVEIANAPVLDGETAELPPRDRLKGCGLRLFGADGLEYLDAVSGTFNLSLGYNHPAVVRGVRAQLERIVHISSHFSGEVVETVKRKLLAHAPPGIDAVWLRDVTGSTAVEGAIKFAQKYTGKTDVISLFHSHHGQTAYTTAISGNAFRRANQPDATSSHSIKVPAPYCHRCFFGAEYPGCGLPCVSRIQDFIDYASSGRVAAVIVEPVQGNGGNIVPPHGYFDELRALCDRNGMLLILDEVQTGIGRTGHMYASETFGIRPDLVVIAKGLGGIGIPVAAILMRSPLLVLDGHEHSFTSGANLVALAAAEATLDTITAPGFLENVRRKSILLRRCLESIGRDSQIVSDVRGVGFMWGLEVVDAARRPSSEVTERIIEVALRKHRLILRNARYGRGNVLKVRPALVATEADLIEITQRLREAIAEVEDGVTRE
ncbi:aspartate aminotransferase family protein [Dokdonella soli]|uniref:Aspartate aminotransferase family protein n=1 Tax=Dokdonella soli TaxID=529810 RepID=A0ABP3TNS2_9GAMM